jgi:hypothetical protein
MERSERQENNRPEEDRRSDDPSSPITKCETQVDNYVYYAAKESLMPYIVISQDSEPLRRRLMSRSVRLGVDSVLRQRSKSYVNSILFVHDINSIFIYYLNELRDSEAFTECEAILLIDNCLPQMEEAVGAILTRERVRVFIFAYHTSHIFQMLDVTLFGILKNSIGLRTFERGQPAAFILNAYHDFKETIAEVNTWNAFAVIEFTHDIEQSPYRLLFDEEKFRQSRGFAELWERDMALKSLSKRLRESKFAWINKPD